MANGSTLLSRKNLSYTNHAIYSYSLFEMAHEIQLSLLNASVSLDDVPFPSS